MKQFLYFPLSLASLFLLNAAPCPAGEPAPRVLGLSHVAVKVSDIEKSRAFYKDFLGFAESGQLTNKDGSLALVFIKVNDDQFLELFTGLTPEEDRLYQVAFYVENAEALRAYLATHGIKTPPSVPKGRIGNLNFTIRDPDGHTLEFVQYEPEGWTRRDKGKFMPATRIAERIRHAGFLADDGAASLAFYSTLFGMTESWRGSANGKTVSWINLKLPGGGDYVELMLAKPAPPPNARGSVNHLSLEVPDIEKAKAALEGVSCRKTYLRPIEIRTGKNKKRQLNLFDTDGTRVELMEPNPVDGIAAPSSTLPLPEK